MVFGGIGLFISGCHESRLAALSKETPDQMTLEELVTKGTVNNIYLTISGIQPQSDEYVYVTKRTRYTKVWIPCVPANSVDRTAKLLLFSTHASDDEAVSALMSSDVHTGMIVNEVRGIESKEKELLMSNLTGTDPDKLLIFEVGRAPSSPLVRILFYLGGITLMLGGLAWILLGR
jgi:hypothetical protein